MREFDSWVWFLGLIPGSGRSPRKGNGYLFQYSCLENSMDRGAWSSQSQGVTESDTTELLTLFTLITYHTSFNSLSGSTEILSFMALFGLEEGVSPQIPLTSAPLSVSPRGHCGGLRSVSSHHGCVLSHHPPTACQWSGKIALTPYPDICPSGESQILRLLGQWRISPHHTQRVSTHRAFCRNSHILEARLALVASFI